MAFFGVAEEDDGGLIVSDSYAGDAKNESALGSVEVYPCFVLEHDVSPHDNFIEILRKVLKNARIGKAKVAIEEKSLPVAAYRLISGVPQLRIDRRTNSAGKRAGCQDTARTRSAAGGG